MGGGVPAWGAAHGGGQRGKAGSSRGGGGVPGLGRGQRWRSACERGVKSGGRRASRDAADSGARLELTGVALVLALEHAHQVRGQLLADAPQQVLVDRARDRAQRRLDEVGARGGVAAGGGADALREIGERALLRLRRAAAAQRVRRLGGQRGGELVDRAAGEPGAERLERRREAGAGLVVRDPGPLADGGGQARLGHPAFLARSASAASWASRSCSSEDGTGAMRSPWSGGG